MFSVRINTLKISPHQCKEKLTAAGVSFAEVSWCDYAVVINSDKNVFFESDFIRNGWCYIQSLSSLLPGILLNPRPGDEVLDLCAAPGGKTMHLSALMNNTGTIIANDVSRSRLYKAADLFKRYGVTNVQTNLGKGEFIWKQYENYFDNVLVDAPCSMNQEYANKNLRRLVQRQRYLLKSAYTALKPGKRLVYSTCTSEPKENTEVITWLQKNFADAVIVKPLIHQKLQEFISDEGFVQISDTKLFDPFFIALIKKPI